MLGIQPKVTMEKTSFLRAAYLSAQMVWIQTAVTVLYLWDKLVTWEKPELAGPVGVIQIMAKSADAGLSSYIRLIAIISVALGLFNLFPIPLVDGGMIILFAVEGIIRKRISIKVIQIYNTIGVGIILLILIFATYSDLIRLGIGKLFH
jgi:regulator of sigma E protease